jgi:hypothetical protein
MHLHPAFHARRHQGSMASACIGHAGGGNPGLGALAYSGRGALLAVGRRPCAGQLVAAWKEMDESL